MGLRNWFEKGKAKFRDKTSNRTERAISNENLLYQQQAASWEPNELPDGSNGSAISHEKLKSRRIEDTKIHELWDVAYEKLREKDGTLIADYEAKLIGNVTAGVGQTLNLKQNRRDWMQAILQNKMEEVNNNKPKLGSGNFKAQATDVMRLVLKVVDSADAYISSAASANPYTSIAWTGVSFLLPLLMNIPEEKAALAKALDYIASLVAQSQIREELYFECYESASNSHQKFQRSHIQYKTALERLYRQILRFQATACCYYLKNSVIRSGLDAIKWNDWVPLIDEVREQDRNFAAIEETWRGIQRFEEHSAVMDSFSVMNANLSALTDKELSDLMQWLCDIDPSSMYNAALDRHEAGTCEWLIKNSEEFKTWETSEGSLLWLHGKAGSGKSILSSSVIKYLRDQYASTPSNVVSYFYFSFSDLKKQEVDGMLASLIKQIWSRQLKAPHITQRLQQYKIKGERPDTETLEAILIASASKFTNLYIIIDALDECPLLNRQRGRLLKSLQRIIANAPPNFHIFLTSRKEPDIEGSIRSILLSPDRVEIDLLARQQILNQDIDHFIRSQLSTEYYANWPPSIKEEARNLLIERADCMFQYVHFQLEALQNLSSQTDIYKALQNLPTGLDATYNRILEYIDINFREQVIHSLKWLAFSTKVLRIEELVEIFIIRPYSDITFNEAERQFTPTDILKYFSGLIITQEGDSSEFKKTQTEVRLVHFSLKEYLMSSRIVEGPTSVFSFTEMKAHLTIAQSCLTYLGHLNPWVASQCEKYFSVDVVTLAYPLAGYAAHNWMTHLERIPHKFWPAKLTRDAARALAVHSQSLLTLLKLCGVPPSRYERLLQPYFFTAQRGHIQLTEMLIHPEFGVIKYVTREELGEAIQIVAGKGDTDMIRVFLEAGADVNAQGGRQGTALQAAAKSGRLDVLKLLVSSGANINGPSIDGRSLLTSIRHSATDCLEFLLDNGADINIQDEMYGTALHAALANDDSAIFDLLLERGADVNAMGRHGTPLQTVCRYQRSFPNRPVALHIARYVKKLLESGANPNLPGRRYGTALQLACDNGRLFPNRKVAMEIVRLLTENGAIEGKVVVSGVAVNIDDGLHHRMKLWEPATARPAAVKSVCSSAVEILKLLLDNGAKLDQSDYTDSGMALHFACINRNQEEARLLLDRGADVNAESDIYGTPLYAVTNFMPTQRRSEEEEDRFKKGTMLIVQLLISEGACVNQVSQKGDNQDTPLQAACGNGLIDLETVRLLLKHGADINAEGGRHGTALGAACATYRRANDMVQLVQLLIKHGANVNVSHEKAPLTIACRRGDEKLVRLLIESGADVRHQNYAAWHAAWYAVAHGRSIDVLRLLLDQAVDINHVHEEYGTALNAMIEEWDTAYGRMQKWHDRLGFLLEHGADVNIKGGKFGFALQTACAPAYIGDEYLLSDINIVSARTKFLLEQCPGIDVNAQGGMFGSALQAAAFSGQTESVQLLLGRGADVDARGGMYGSALNAAIIGGYWDIVDILLQAKATPDYCLQKQPDEEWLQRVGEKCPRRVGRRNDNGKKDGRGAVARYRKFWEVESGSTAESG